MQNVQGFLLINIYALLLIVATSTIFFGKQRLRQVEDELYKKFLIANIFMSVSGLLLGFIVSPIFPFDEKVTVIFNKSNVLDIYTYVLYCICIT